MAIRKKQQLPAYSLRLQPDIRKELEKSAKLGGRSLHAEIVSRLVSTISSIPTGKFEKSNNPFLSPPKGLLYIKSNPWITPLATDEEVAQIPSDLEDFEKFTNTIIRNLKYLKEVGKSTQITHEKMKDIDKDLS